jgi:hypothetical protein
MQRRSPMQPKKDGTWTAWAAAEAAGDHEAADDALRAAMRGVVQHTPSPALSSRLMKAARVPIAGRRRTSERLVALGVIGGAAVMTLLPATVVAAFFIADAGRVVSWLAHVCVWLTEWLNAGVSIWTVVGRTGSVLGRIVSGQVGGVLLTVTLLIASSALLALNRFLPEERS